MPLVERKRLLKQLLEGQPAMLRYSEHLESPGEDVYAQACRLGLEGIVSKRRDAPYQNRRGTDWLKVKCALRQEMVIGGYTDPGGSRMGFGALLLGVHDAEGNLRYCGKVGTGFNDALLRSLAPKLRKMEQDTPPFVNPPRGYEAKGAHWIRPTLVGEVAFTEWTRDGTVRHPSFQGLRADKKAADVVLEKPVDASEVIAAKPARAGAGRRTSAQAVAPAATPPATPQPRAKASRSTSAKTRKTTAAAGKAPDDPPAPWFARVRKHAPRRGEAARRNRPTVRSPGSRSPIRPRSCIPKPATPSSILRTITRPSASAWSPSCVIGR